MSQTETTVRDVLEAASREIDMAKDLLDDIQDQIADEAYVKIDSMLTNAWMLIHDITDPYELTGKAVTSVDFSIWTTPAPESPKGGAA